MEKDFNISKLKLIYAADIMNPQVAMISANATVGQIVHLLLRDRSSGYPVVDASNKVVGIVTLTDLFAMLDKMSSSKEADLQAMITEYKSKPIGELMTKNVITINKHTSLAEMIDIMAKSKIHNFPVVENGQLVGIIGRHDVLSAVFVYA